MTDRTATLDALMRQHNLTARQVGDMLGRTAHTVRCWRCRIETNTIPQHALELLQMKIAAGKGGAQ